VVLEVRQLSLAADATPIGPIPWPSAGQPEGPTRSAITGQLLDHHAVIIGTAPWYHAVISGCWSRR